MLTAIKNPSTMLKGLMMASMQAFSFLLQKDKQTAPFQSQTIIFLDDSIILFVLKSSTNSPFLFFYASLLYRIYKRSYQKFQYELFMSLKRALLQTFDRGLMTFILSCFDPNKLGRKTKQHLSVDSKEESSTLTGLSLIKVESQVASVCFYYQAFSFALAAPLIYLYSLLDRLDSKIAMGLLSAPSTRNSVATGSLLFFALSNSRFYFIKYNSICFSNEKREVAAILTMHSTIFFYGILRLRISIEFLEIITSGSFIQSLTQRIVCCCYSCGKDFSPCEDWQRKWISFWISSWSRYSRFICLQSFRIDSSPSSLSSSGGLSLKEDSLAEDLRVSLSFSLEELSQMMEDGSVCSSQLVVWMGETKMTLVLREGAIRVTVLSLSSRVDQFYSIFLQSSLIFDFVQVYNYFIKRGIDCLDCSTETGETGRCCVFDVICGN